MTTHPPNESAAVRSLSDARRRLFEEMEALRNKIAGLDMAIDILREQERKATRP